MNGPLPPGFELRQGPCFRYVLPPGWQVAEDGQFAVVLVAPDRRAISALVGNAGMPLGYPPHQYLWERLMAFRPEGLQLGQPRPGPALSGVREAWELEVTYAIGGVPCCGIARCHVAPSYDSSTLVMTFAASERALWPSYGSWLPDLPMQTMITHAAAFGAAGIAQQNLAQSMELGRVAQAHRQHSQELWAGVSSERQASQDRQAFERGQGLAGVERYDNPYTGQSVDLPSGNQSYWVHPATGQIVGDSSASFDPRTSGDPSWQRLRRTQGGG